MFWLNIFAAGVFQGEVKTVYGPPGRFVVVRTQTDPTITTPVTFSVGRSKIVFYENGKCRFGVRASIEIFVTGRRPTTTAGADIRYFFDRQTRRDRSIRPGVSYVKSDGFRGHVFLNTYPGVHGTHSPFE